MNSMNISARLFVVALLAAFAAGMIAAIVATGVATAIASSVQVAWEKQANRDKVLIAEKQALVRDGYWDHAARISAKIKSGEIQGKETLGIPDVMHIARILRDTGGYTYNGERFLHIGK